MYKAFYGLREKPFNLTPDPRFLYLSEKHKEAFAHLLYGIRSRSGFVMVTGEIGTGKTTICRNLLNQLDEDTELAFIFNPMLSPLELLKKIVSEFGIEATGSNALELTEELNEYLLEAAARGKNCVLLIDEAQNLETGVLEQIRLLSNLETETEKLLQIVLIGQPELGEKLTLHELRQLNQRITARYHLKALNEKEVMQYVAYRLHVAGGRRAIKFSRSAVRAVYKISKGTPRVINALCDRALLIGFTKETHTINAGIIHRAHREIRGDRIFGRRAPRWTFRRLVRNPLIGVAAAGIAAAIYLNSATVQTGTNAAFDRLVAALPTSGGGPDADRPNVVEATVALPSSTEPPTAPEATPAIAMAATPVAPTTSAAPPVAMELTAPLQASPAPDAPIRALEAVVAESNKAESEAAALRAVLAAWGRDVGAASTGTLDASLETLLNGRELSHDRLHPALEQLVALDLPALVRVVVAGEPRWVALTGATADSLTIVASDTPVTVERADFLSMYAAEAIVPWNDPAPGTPTLRKGHQSAQVAALKDKLVRLDRLRADNTSDVYDVETVSAISRIQAETSLEVDGISGQQVRMVLTSWLKEGETPSLTGRTAPPPSTLVAREEPAVADVPEVAVAASEEPRIVQQPATAPETAPEPARGDAEPELVETVVSLPSEAVTPIPETAPATETALVTDPAPVLEMTPVMETAPAPTAPEFQPEPEAAVRDVHAIDVPEVEADLDVVNTLGPELSPATVTLTNINRDADTGDVTGMQSDNVGAENSGISTGTIIQISPDPNAHMTVTELDDPGSLPPEDGTPGDAPDNI